MGFRVCQYLGTGVYVFGLASALMLGSTGFVVLSIWGLPANIQRFIVPLVE